MSQGKYDEAGVLYKQCLDKSKVVLGDRHPQTLATMHNIAVTYIKQGKYDEAEVLYKQCLDQRRRVLGDNNPDTLTTMHSLAGIYKNQGYIHVRLVRDEI